MIGRPPRRHSQTVQRLRTLVVNHYAAGSRLLSHLELAAKFGVSGETMQRAIRTLRDEGFIETRSRQGMYVSDRLPHFTNHVLILPGNETGDNPSQFWMALKREAGVITEEDRVSVSTIPDYEFRTAPALEQRLCDDVREHRVAGLIFGALFKQLEGTPLMDEAGIPRAAISEHAWSTVACVYPDLTGFMNLALDHLAARGCRRVGLVGTIDWRRRFAMFEAGCARRGLKTDSLSQLVLALTQGVGIATCAELLLRRPKAERMDGLIIADDNLLPQVSAGIVASGVPVVASGEKAKVGSLCVVAHTNFPYPTECQVPVTRLGFSVRTILDQCVRYVESQRRGEETPAMTLVPAQFA